MALNRDFVGREYESSPPFEIGRELIRHFSTAIGDFNPVSHDVDAAQGAGHRDLVAPPTFPVVITMASSGSQILTDPELGLDYRRVVHGDQKFAYTRPVVAGDALVCVNSVDEITSRAGHDFMTTRTEVTTEAGEPVVTVWSKLVQRGEA